MIFNRTKNSIVCKKVNFSTSFFGLPDYLHRRNIDTIELYDLALLTNAAVKLHEVRLAIALDR